MNKKNIKKEYKRLIASVMAASVIFTTGCSAKKYSDNLSEKYTVQKGDTLYSIALDKYKDGSLASKIADYNGIKDKDLIYTGQVIILPSLDNLEYYEVKEGDTLYQICRDRYGYANQDLVYRLATYNDLKDPSMIRRGSTLLLPEIEVLNSLTPYDYGFTLKK